MVSPSPQVRKEIRELLLKEKYVEEVYEREELYVGDHSREAPDLLLMLKEGYEPRSWAKDVVENVEKPRENKTRKMGTHQGFSARKALFMAKGKSIKKGYVVNPNIIDIAPTVLELLNTKIPSTMEGQVLNIFE